MKGDFLAKELNMRKQFILQLTDKFPSCNLIIPYAYQFLELNFIPLNHLPQA